jgi:Golgi phosphoprotein 3 (GPP34)
VHVSAGPLAGTGRVADDLFLIAHDERSGRLLLAPRQLGTGLAAALLAEVMLAGGIIVDNGRVGGVTVNSGLVVACRADIADELAAHVHRAVAAEPQLHPVQVWLEFLARDAARNVAFRLERAGYLEPAPRRRPWGAARLVPVNPDWAYAPLSRACGATAPGRRFYPGHAVLAGLAEACGLGFRLAGLLPAGRAVTDATARLDLPLRQLISQTQTVVSAAVLAHRT